MEQSKKISRKVISALLSLLMVFSCFSGLSLTAGADTNEVTITFKSSGSSSDGSSARDSVDTITDSGATHVSSLSASKVYNGKDGCGIKLGSSSQAGSLTLNLSSPMTVSAITVEAKKYSASDSSCGLTIQDKTYDGVSSDFGTFTYTYAQPTEISSVALSSTGKRIYIKSVTLIGQAASAEPETPKNATEWHVGDTINIGGKYYINDDQGAPSSCGFDRDVIVSEPVYETMYNQWIFENVIASNASEAFALYISLPAGKTEADVPAGFKVKSGDGTQASPYQFELVYAAATTTISFTKVTSADEITAENIGTCAAEDAKSWAIANWDDVTAEFNSGAGAVELAFYSNTGKLNEVMVFEGMDEEAFLENFDSFYSTDIPINNPQALFGQGDTVYLCTPAAPAEDGPLVGTVIKVGDTLTLDGDYIECMPGVIDQVTDSLKLERMEYDNYFNGWGAVFEDAYAFLIAGDETPEPDGFYVSGGNGTQSHPYTLALHYASAEPASSAYAGYVPAEADDATALAAKVVKFNGYDWYLIEDNSTSETEGTVTLFAKDTIGSSRFDNSNSVYSGSMVKSYLDNLTAEGGAFADVSDAIVSTDLEDVTVTGAKLWLLSKDEVITTYKLSTALNKCSNDWWLRTHADTTYVIFVNGTSGSVDNVGNSCMNTYGVRPALKLDLSKVEFNSETKTFALPQPLVEYTLWVGGVKVTNKNASNIDGNNKASYDAETNTLTLNGYTNSGTARADIQSGVNNAAIYYNDNMSSPNPLTIQLVEGTTNSLTMTGDRVYGIYVFGSALTITGNGTLNVQSDDMAINDAWGVAITGGTVNAASSAYYGIGRVTIGADISSVTITGELGAIYGGSNEEQELINAVAGTGWTDTAGMTGKAAIAISTTGQNVSSYKKVYFTPHTHNFTYSVSGATITATCTADDCTLTDSRATLTIVAPTLTVYGGTGSAAATLDGLDAFNAATGLNVDADSIVYWKAKIIEGVYKTDGNEPLAGAPTNAGNYLAKITVSNCIASVGYTIAKADPIYTAPTGLTAVFGDLLSKVTLPDGWSWTNALQSVGNAIVNTFKAIFTPADTANYNTVEDVDVDVTVNKADIAPTVSLEGWTYGETAKTPVVSGNPGEGTVSYTYAVKGSDEFSETVPTATGNYTVKATVAATANYNGGTATADFTIAKANITPTVSISGWTYGQAAKTPSVSGNSGNGTVTYTYATKGSDSFSATVPTNAGNYTVKATIAATANYNGGTATADFTIAKADIAPTVSIDGWTYNQTANAPSVSGNAGGGSVTYTYAVKGSDEFAAEVPTNAGEYTVKATIAETTNYNSGEATADFTIAKADIAPTVSIEGWTYGQEANAPSVSGNTGNGAVTYTYATKGSDSFSATVPTNAGNYTVKATVAATTNYNGGTATAEFTIAKADSVPATVTANEITCDGTEKALVTVTGEVAGGEMQYALGKDAQTAPEDGWSTDIPAATNTGTYFVWYKVVADENHNDSTPVYVEVTIDPNYTVKEVTGLSGNGKDEWTKGGEDGVVITVKDSGEDNSFDHFTGVKLDGQLLTKDVDYTATKGSTIVTLLPATLEKLSVGEHTVTVLFDNGEVNTDLTVKAANSGNPTSPQTGDNSHMGLWIAIMILSLCALATMLFIGKKKRVFDR